MLVAQPLRLLPGAQPVGRDVGQRKHLRLQQRRLNVLPVSRAPGAAPELQRSTPASDFRTRPLDGEVLQATHTAPALSTPVITSVMATPTF
jgi:hypothetical protein